MKLSARVYIPAIVVAVAAGTGGFLLSQASAGTVTHTLSFTAVQQAAANFASTSGELDNDVDKSGKVIGYDILSIAFNQKTKKATIDVALVTDGGMLYGVMPTSAPVSAGRVTGGTGTFQGATGSITATVPNHSTTHTNIVITYHT